MAQLIKLQDYASRYAQDIYLYPSRYVRLKKQQWAGVKDKWENGPETAVESIEKNKVDENQQMGIFRKIKSIVKQQEPAFASFENEEQPVDEKVIDDNDFMAISKIHTQGGLKQYFLDRLLPFQLKWASSTLTEKSFVEKGFYDDATLKFLLQRFPDTFLILYKPIFLLKKAPVEAELILVTPAAAICISILEEENDAVFVGSKERFWIKKTKNKQLKVLNPLLALNRTEKIVQALFSLYEVDLPVQKVLLSRNGFIDFPQPPYGLQLIEKRNFEEWFLALRGMKSPLKHMQLKAAQILLQYCQTTSVRRLEWDTSQKKDEQY